MYYLYANWKSNKNITQAADWVTTLQSALSPESKKALEEGVVEIGVFPSYPHIQRVSDMLKGKKGFVVGTQDVSEYGGLLNGLEKSLELGATEIAVRSDSQLLVRQLLGQYKVKAPHIIPLVEKAKRLLSRFKQVDISHIPREENSVADALCNEALDKSS